MVAGMPKVPGVGRVAVVVEGDLLQIILGAALLQAHLRRCATEVRQTLLRPVPLLNDHATPSGPIVRQVELAHFLGRHLPLVRWRLHHRLVRRAVRCLPRLHHRSPHRLLMLLRSRLLLRRHVVLRCAAQLGVPAARVGRAHPLVRGRGLVLRGLQRMVAVGDRVYLFRRHAGRDAPLVRRWPLLQLHHAPTSRMPALLLTLHLAPLVGLLLHRAFPKVACPTTLHLTPRPSRSPPRPPRPPPPRPLLLLGRLPLPPALQCLHAPPPQSMWLLSPPLQPSPQNLLPPASPIGSLPPLGSAREPVKAPPLGPPLGL
mmetsp:Transcript_111818/g.281406  ORF Transcript_111818/g.281406 Transcript_111818/m.281406 type:complete len:315 (-) Transcript_111818:1055-1999(-)